MSAFLLNYGGTLLVAAALAAAVAAIVVCRVKARKKGGAACSCGCASCPQNGRCCQK